MEKYGNFKKITELGLKMKCPKCLTDWLPNQPRCANPDCGITFEEALNMRRVTKVVESFYGIPKEDGGDSAKNDAKMEDCVSKVMAKGHDKESAIRICKKSLGFTKDSAAEEPEIDPEATVPCAHCGESVAYKEVQAAHIEDAKVPIPWEPRLTGRQMVRHTRWDAGIVAPEHQHCNNSKNYLINVIMDEHASEGERKEADTQLRGWYGERSNVVHPFAHTGDWPPVGPEEPGRPRKKSGDSMTLGSMIGGYVDRLHSLRERMISDRNSGMAPEDVVSKYAYKVFKSDEAAKADRQSASGPQGQRLKRGFFGGKWQAAYDAATAEREAATKVATYNDNGKEASVTMETDHISESGPTPVTFITDHEGKLAMGINPATCETCSAPMEMHNKWETNKQHIATWIGPEDRYNTLVEHFANYHEITGFGKYAGSDDDLTIDYLNHLHKTVHEKQAQLVDQNLINLATEDHVPAGDIGTWLAWQASGNPDIKSWAAEMHDQQHKDDENEENDFKLEHTTEDHERLESVTSSVKDESSQHQLEIGIIGSQRGASCTGCDWRIIGSHSDEALQQQHDKHVSSLGAKCEGCGDDIPVAFVGKRTRCFRGVPGCNDEAYENTPKWGDPPSEATRRRMYEIATQPD